MFAGVVSRYCSALEAWQAMPMTILFSVRTSQLYSRKMYLDAGGIVGGDNDIYNSEARFRDSDETRQLAIEALSFVLFPRAS